MSYLIIAFVFIGIVEKGFNIGIVEKGFNDEITYCIE